LAGRPGTCASGRGVREDELRPGTARCRCRAQRCRGCPSLTDFCLSRAAAAAGAAMRAVLWDLLLLCLFARARGDCRGDCLRCDRYLYRDSFDVLVSPPPRAAPTGAVPAACPHAGWAPSSLGLGLGSGGASVPALEGKVPPAVTVPPPWAPPRDTSGGPKGGCGPQIGCQE